MRLAEGEPDEGDAGGPLTRLRRLPGGAWDGGAGDSQKNDPRPGELEDDAGPPSAGDAMSDAG